MSRAQRMTPRRAEILRYLIGYQLARDGYIQLPNANPSGRSKARAYLILRHPDGRPYASEDATVVHQQSES